MVSSTSGNILNSGPNCSKNSTLNARKVYEIGNSKTELIYGIIIRINPKQQVRSPRIITQITIAI